MLIGVLSSIDGWYLSDLRRAARDEHTIVPLSFRDLAAAIEDGRETLRGGGNSLSDFDALLVRSMQPASLESVVFRMDLLARAESLGLPVINPAKAIEAAVDKYLTTARLAAAGLRVPRTRVSQTVDDALADFAALGGDVVLKPLFGGEGRGIARLTDDGMAQRAFGLLASLGAVIYQQEFVPHAGHDLRVLLIGSRHWVVRRSNSLDWRTNLSRGATAQPLEPTPEIIDLARRAAEAVAAPVAGVDLLPDRHGTLHVLEVNAVPGWRITAPALGVDIAACLLDYVVQTLGSRR